MRITDDQLQRLRTEAVALWRHPDGSIARCHRSGNWTVAYRSSFWCSQAPMDLDKVDALLAAKGFERV